MKRGIAVFACVCAFTIAVYFGISKWGIRHQSLDLFDPSRQRPISVDIAIRWDYEMKADDGFWKLPVAIISNGNTVKNTEYSFLANVFAARGYLVASIQQDIPTDPPLMTKVGLPYVGRQAVRKRRSQHPVRYEAIAEAASECGLRSPDACRAFQRRGHCDVFCQAAPGAGLQGGHAR